MKPPYRATLRSGSTSTIRVRRCPVGERCFILKKKLFITFDIFFLHKLIKWLDTTIDVTTKADMHCCIQIKISYYRLKLRKKCMFSLKVMNTFESKHVFLLHSFQKLMLSINIHIFTYSYWQNLCTYIKNVTLKFFGVWVRWEIPVVEVYKFYFIKKIKSISIKIHYFKIKCTSILILQCWYFLFYFL